MKRIPLALLALMLSATAAHADVTLKMQETNLREKTPATSNGTLWMTGDRLASLWDKAKKDDEATHIIYRGDKQLLWMIMDEDKKYMEMTKESLEQMGNQMGDAMATMKAELAKLPPEQRKMMEEQFKNNPMMGGGTDASAPVRTVRKTAETKTINGFPCTKYEVSADGKLKSEVWATPHSKFEVKPADMKVLVEMTRVFESLTSRLGGAAGASANRFGNLEGIDGMPILSRYFGPDGKPTSETTVQSVSRERADPKLFELPDGYARSDPMSGRKR